MGWVCVCVCARVPLRVAPVELYFRRSTFARLLIAQIVLLHKSRDQLNDLLFYEQSWHKTFTGRDQIDEIIFHFVSTLFISVLRVRIASQLRIARISWYIWQFRSGDELWPLCVLRRATGFSSKRMKHLCDALNSEIFFALRLSHFCAFRTHSRQPSSLNAMLIEKMWI